MYGVNPYHDRQYHQVPKRYLAIDSFSAILPVSAIFPPFFSDQYSAFFENQRHQMAEQDGDFEIVMLSIIDVREL